MGIFPLQDKVADRRFNMRTRYLSPAQALVCGVFPVLPAVYTHQIRHITVIRNNFTASCIFLLFCQFFHIPPCAIYTACHFFSNHRVSIFYNNLAEIHFWSDNLHVFMLFHKFPDLRVFQTCIYIDCPYVPVHLPCDMQ